MPTTPTSFEFEFVGGRCKLISDEPISLLREDIVVAETYKKMRLQKQLAQQQKEERQRKRLEEKQRNKVVEFLKKHNFDPEDVHAEQNQKASCLSMLQWRCKLQPLHQAARDDNVEMIFLLLQFGADPNRKDSKGNTAYDYVECCNLRGRMRTLHKMAQYNGGLTLQRDETPTEFQSSRVEGQVL